MTKLFRSACIVMGAAFLFAAIVMLVLGARKFDAALDVIDPIFIKTMIVFSVSALFFVAAGSLQAPPKDGTDAA